MTWLQQKSLFKLDHQGTVLWPETERAAQVLPGIMQGPEFSVISVSVVLYLHHLRTI